MWLPIHVVMDYKDDGWNVISHLRLTSACQKEEKKTEAFWPRWSACVGGRRRESKDEQRVELNKAGMVSHQLPYSVVSTQMHQCELTMRVLFIKPKMH